MISRQKKDKQEINNYIYTELTERVPSRYEMVRYSTWRIYAYNELESQISDFKNTDSTWNHENLQKIGKSKDQKGFYDILYKPSLDNSKQQYQRYDNISHFIARMLYSREDSTRYKFISMEKRILQNRLKAQLNLKQNNTRIHRAKMMELFKKILAHLKNKKVSEYDVPNEEWNRLSDKITFYTKSFMSNYEPSSQQYAKMPLEEGDIGLRKRRSFMQQGFVYISCEIMIDIITNSYDSYLRDKLEKTQPLVNQLISQDTDNQFSVFLSKTIKQIYEETMDEQKLNENHKLTLRNIEYVGNRYFPPCMLNLNQHLKKDRHLRHDGRRQLWGFFKSCGMDVQDNKEYFRAHFEGKVTASEMRGHMYNIEHAYGLKGQRKDQHSWTCRGIISNAAPKKGQHHGCPFTHWRKQELSEFLRRNYKVTQNKLDQIMDIKEQKHFQIACGRLFEYSEINQYEHVVPAEITAKLGKAPHMFFQAGMELRRIKQGKGKTGNKMGEQGEQHKSVDIEF